MHVPGLLPITELSHSTALDVLLLGGDDAQAEALAEAGFLAERHDLDMGPLAQLAGVPFTPPVVEWPFPDSAYDVVLLLDQLALTVREEEALAEAARVLRPGGILVLRVPAEGPLAWLDGFNAYRYVQETTRRGERPPEVRGVGWRRHYSRADLHALLQTHFQVRQMRESGLGLTDAARLGLNLYWRWARDTDRRDATIRRISAALTRLEGGWSLAGRGYSLVVVAERLPDP